MDTTPSTPRRLLATLRRGGALALLCCALLSADALAQGGRLDQVFVRDSKGAVRQMSCTFIENSLTRLVLQRGDKETPYDNDRVDRVIWGAVSTGYREGQAFFDRGDYENAAAKFTMAAVEDPREVVKAVARRRAGESYLNLAKTDPSHYGPALDEFSKFLTDYADDRAVPEVRMLQARCTLLRGSEGDLAAAGALYRGIFEEGSGSEVTPGYDQFDCFQSGLSAAHALIGAGETLPAREILGVLSNSVRSKLVSLEDGSLEKLRLEALAGEAQLGEGFVQLATNQARQAETFFSAQLQNASTGPAVLRFGARLGLGEALMAQGKLREASMEFGHVASLDYTSRDRTAHSMLRLAECLGKLGDIDGAAQSRARLTTIIESFGDTPSAAKARELLK